MAPIYIGYGRHNFLTISERCHGQRSQKKAEALVNSSDRASARKAIHHEVHFERSLTLPDEIPSTKVADLNPLFDAFEQAHTPIKGYFCSGVGIDLQNKDAAIAERVLLHFSKMGYAILPMHDSFTIHHGLEAELRTEMEAGFKQMFGVSCRVDLKYSSLLETRKESGDESDECTGTLRELVEHFAEYGRHEHLLNEHRKALESIRKAKPAGGGQAL